MTSQLTTIDGGDGTPPEPDWSRLFPEAIDRDFARTDWTRIVGYMRDENTLAVTNGHSIERLVHFRVEFERALRHVGRHGAVVKKARAKVGVWNLYWSVMRQADETIRALEAELGLSPSRRSRAGKVKRRSKAERAADRYLKPIP